MAKKKDRSKLIEEITDYILEHDGPDGDGRGHPSMKMLNCSDLEEAIALARREGLSEDVRPYHFRKTLGVWTYEDGKTSEYAGEVLLKKFDQLLERNYGGDLVSLVTNFGSRELLGNFIDVVGGREVNVSMVRIGTKFSSSNFLMIGYYLDSKGLADRFSNLKPYHLRQASSGYFEDPVLVDELLLKKVDQLIEQYYGGDLVRFITNVSSTELIRQPFVDILDGRKVGVSMSSVRERFGSSVYRMVSHYLSLKGLDDRFSNLRPYHLKRSGNGVFNDPGIVDEILVKKVDQLLEQDYGGDVERFLANVNQFELRTPFVDILDGREVEVSVGSAMQKFNERRSLILGRYCEIKGIDYDIAA